MEMESDGKINKDEKSHLKKLEDKITNTEKLLDILKSLRKEMQESKIKKGDLVWHPSYGNCLVLDIHPKDTLFIESQIVATIAHTKGSIYVNGSSFITTTDLKDLLPINESVKVLHG